MSEKRCTLCGLIKPVALFSKHGSTADKLDQRCKECVNKYKKEHRGKVTKTYPLYDFDSEDTEWQVGKPAGYITMTPTGATVTIRSKDIRHTKTYGYNAHGGKENARLNAMQWQIDTSNKLRLTRNRIRMVEDSADTIEVELTKGFTMITDFKFVDTCQKYSLCVTKSGNKNAEYYCTMTIDGIQRNFHNFITGWKMVDHINRNTLDNRLCNLRETTSKQNNNNKNINPRKNTSGCVGVRFVTDRVGGAWQARIKQDNKERTVSFSVNNFGYEEAKQLAIATRKSLNKIYDSVNGEDPETGIMQTIESS